MKFLFVCSGLGGGGAERVAVNLANGLVGMGNEVSIFTRPVEESYSTGDKVGVIVAVSSGFWGRFFSLFREIKNNNYDAIVSFTDSPNIDAFFAWRLSGSKAVYSPTIHSDICARESR